MVLLESAYEGGMSPSRTVIIDVGTRGGGLFTRDTDIVMYTVRSCAAEDPPLAGDTIAILFAILQNDVAAPAPAAPFVVARSRPRSPHVSLARRRACATTPVARIAWSACRGSCP